MKKLWILALCALLFGGCSTKNRELTKKCESLRLEFSKSRTSETDILSEQEPAEAHLHFTQALGLGCLWAERLEYARKAEKKRIADEQVWGKLLEEWRQEEEKQKQEEERQRQKEEKQRQEEERQRQEEERQRQIQAKRHAEWESWQHKKAVCKNKDDEKLFFFGDLYVSIGIEMHNDRESKHMCREGESDKPCVDAESVAIIRQWLERKKKQLLQSKQCKIVEFNPTRSAK